MVERRSVLILDRADSPRPELAAACVELGLEPTYLGDLKVGRPLAQLLDETLDDVDLVLLVIDNASVPPSIMFEAGLAHGRGVPVAVLDGRGPKLPGSTDDLALETLLPGPRLYAHLSDLGGIIEQLDSFLQLQSTADRPGKAEAIQPSRGRLFQEPVSYASEAEQRTAEALTELGAVVLADRVGSRSVPDLIARFPQLELAMNPVLVEIKGRKAHLGPAREQLRAALSLSHARLGLLITLDPLPPASEWVGPGQVVAQISLGTLEQAPDRLLKLLSEARNLAVHGG